MVRISFLIAVTKYAAKNNIKEEELVQSLRTEVHHGGKARDLQTHNGKTGTPEVFINLPSECHLLGDFHIQTTKCLT